MIKHDEDDQRNPPNDDFADNLTSGDALTRHIAASGFDPTTVRSTQTRRSGEDHIGPGPSQEDPAEPGPSRARTSNTGKAIGGPDT